MHTLEQLRSGALAGIRRLNLNAAGLTQLPPEVFDLANTLEVLDLSDNALSTLPDDLPRLSHLKVLFCANNAFTEVPRVLARCQRLETVGFRGCRVEHVPEDALPPRLRSLVLTDNRVRSLPQSLGRLPWLEKLMLAGNELSALPAGLHQAPRLALIRLASNQLEILPPELLAMPQLAWLALAGNPVLHEADHPHTDASASPRIAWQELQLQDRLGEGTSGVIHRARWQPADGGPAQDVAVKLFKSQLTSDGLPLSEMAATLAAGRHPALTGALGRLSGHPQGCEGLVMPLIPADFLNLARPPSLDSCTRDLYPADFRPSPCQALRLVADVAQATAHLHERQVLHGDLYAHNTLWQPTTGAARLGDFGAAADLSALPAPQRRALLATEVRAFGWLVDEVLSSTQAPEDSSLHPEASALVRALDEVKTACLEPQPGLRPGMLQVAETLASRLASGPVDQG